MKHKTWTNREVEYLRAAYERGEPGEWIGMRLGGRSRSSITGMARRLGLKHPHPYGRGRKFIQTRTLSAGNITNHLR